MRTSSNPAQRSWSRPGPPGGRVGGVTVRQSPRQKSPTPRHPSHHHLLWTAPEEPSAAGRPAGEWARSSRKAARFFLFSFLLFFSPFSFFLHLTGQDLGRLSRWSPAGDGGNNQSCLFARLDQMKVQQEKKKKKIQLSEYHFFRIRHRISAVHFFLLSKRKKNKN